MGSSRTNSFTDKTRKNRLTITLALEYITTTSHQFGENYQEFMSKPMSRPKHIAPAKAGCLLRIKSAIEMFKPAERAVADYVLTHPEQVMNMSVSETARDVEVGESTVIRFCRALGYKGYQEFRLRLAQDLVEPVEFIHENITFGDSSADLVQKVFQTNIKAVGDTMKAVDPQMVEVAAKALADAGRVDIYGVGYSSLPRLMQS